MCVIWFKCTDADEEILKTYGVKDLINWLKNRECTGIQNNTNWFDDMANVEASWDSINTSSFVDVMCAFDEFTRIIRLNFHVGAIPLETHKNMEYSQWSVKYAAIWPVEVKYKPPYHKCLINDSAFLKKAKSFKKITIAGLIRMHVEQLKIGVDKLNKKFAEDYLIESSKC